MKVLSLFDGIACGYEALQRAGIRVDKYYASEIDKYAIQISMKNHPDIIQLGDVNDRENRTLEPGSIDLIIGGSPCQGFSMAGKMLNFNDPRSALFFKFVDIVKHYKPKYFLLENVKMKKEFQDVITGYMGVEPIQINSALVSAQNRKRLYRTNIPGVTQPEDRGILLKDILEDNVDEKYYFSKERWDRIVNGKYEIIKRVEDIEGKCATLVTNNGGNHEKKIFISYAPGSREFMQQGWKTDKSPTICARDYKDPKVVFIPCGTQYSSSENFGNSFGSQKAYTLRASCPNGVIEDIGIVRKLTPIECERLQTLPDNYTEGVSDSQRYKALGNGWTVDVIAHILSFIK